jgi:hypothetical protein
MSVEDDLLIYPRVRETIENNSAETAIYQIRFGDSGPWTSFGTREGVDRRKRICDQIVPHFTQMLKCGAFLPLNPMKVESHEESWVPGSVSAESRLRSDNSVTFQGQGRLYETYGDAGTPLPLPEEPPLSDFVAAVVAAQSNVANADWDVLTFAAELHESAEFIKGVAHTFNQRTRDLAIKAVKIYRRSKRRGLIHSAWYYFRQLWLAERFSIRPMIGDVQNIVSSLESAVQDNDLLRGRGRNIVEGNRTLNTSLHINDNATGYTFQNLSWKWTIRAFSYLYVSKGALHKFGIDPLVTAWEKIPYSFVVDYFTNVGSWVSTLAPTFKGDFMGTGMSLRYSVSYDISSSIDWHDSAAQIVSGHHMVGALYRMRLEGYKRLGPPSITFPTLRPRLTPARIADLASLFLKGKADVTRILARA